MASNKVVHLNAENFESVTGSDKPVLVDFWAAWCGPCLRVAPVLDELAEEHEDKLTIAKLNMDENQEIAFRYNVQSIPTFILFQNGEIKDRMLGAMPKAAFEKFIERNLASAVA